MGELFPHSFVDNNLSSVSLRYISNWISRIGGVHFEGTLNAGFSENATVGSV